MKGREGALTSSAIIASKTWHLRHFYSSIPSQGISPSSSNSSNPYFDFCPSLNFQWLQTWCQQSRSSTSGAKLICRFFQKHVTLRVERWNKLTNLLFYHLEPCHLRIGVNLLCSSAWQRNGTAPAFSGGKMGSPCRCLPCLRLSPEHFFLNTCPLFHLNTWPSITWSPDHSLTCAPFSQSPAIISPEEPPAPFLSWPNINFYALP